MTTENRRKEDMSKAQTEEPRESLVPPLNSAIVDKAEKEASILPSDHYTYIAMIESQWMTVIWKEPLLKSKATKELLA